MKENSNPTNKQYLIFTLKDKKFQISILNLQHYKFMIFII